MESRQSKYAAKCVIIIRISRRYAKNVSIRCLSSNPGPAVVNRKWNQRCDRSVCARFENCSVSEFTAGLGYTIQRTVGCLHAYHGRVSNVGRIKVGQDGEVLGLPQ